MLHGFMVLKNPIEHHQRTLWTIVMKTIGKLFIIQVSKSINSMKKVINITEEELTKIVKRAINENEESTFELFGRMIQRMDDDIASCVQAGLQNLYEITEEIELDEDLTESQKKSLINFIENIEDTYI